MKCDVNAIQIIMACNKTLIEFLQISGTNSCDLRINNIFDSIFIILTSNIKRLILSLNDFGVWPRCFSYFEKKIEGKCNFRIFVVFNLMNIFIFLT